MSPYDTREQWLAGAIIALSEKFEALGHTLPKVRVSVGWPHRGSAGTIGQCFPPSMASDKVSQIFISPTLGDPVRILDVLAHELVHAVVQKAGGSGHGKDFAAIAKPLGLTGKMTATVAGPELAEWLKDLAHNLGEFPHGTLSSGALTPAGKSRSGSLLKLVCASGEDFKVSISKTALGTYGAPSCPCHSEEMTEAG